MRNRQVGVRTASICSVVALGREGMHGACAQPAGGAGGRRLCQDQLGEPAHLRLLLNKLGLCLYGSPHSCHIACQCATPCAPSPQPCPLLTCCQNQNQPTLQVVTFKPLDDSPPAQVRVCPSWVAVS